MLPTSDAPLKTLLRDVSRSFYLTIRALPREVRQPIGLAYLLARASDTLADTEAVPVEFRMAALEQLRRAMLSGGSPPDCSRFLADLPKESPGHPTDAEKVLLRKIPEALVQLEQTETADRERIRRVLEIITGGQLLDVERFARAAPEAIVALPDHAALDDYTYRVAGCVGEFWTRICRAHLFPTYPLNEAAFLADGIRFGKGLQLVNILRDLPKDLRIGRCYLPLDQLGELGLQPGDLLGSENARRVAPLYQSLLDRARGHLDAGWRYTNSMPTGMVRVRLACAWPILIGIETVELLRKRNVLDVAQRIKVSRGGVRSILFRSIVTLVWPPAWRRLDRWAELRARGSLESA